MYNKHTMQIPFLKTSICLIFVIFLLVPLSLSIKSTNAQGTPITARIVSVERVIIPIRDASEAVEELRSKHGTVIQEARPAQEASDHCVVEQVKYLNDTSNLYSFTVEFSENVSAIGTTRNSVNGESVADFLITQGGCLPILGRDGVTSVRRIDFVYQVNPGTILNGLDQHEGPFTITLTSVTGADTRTVTENVSATSSGINENASDFFIFDFKIPSIENVVFRKLGGNNKEKYAKEGDSVEATVNFSEPIKSASIGTTFTIGSNTYTPTTIGLVTGTLPTPPNYRDFITYQFVVPDFDPELEKETLSFAFTNITDRADNSLELIENPTFTYQEQENARIAPLLNVTGSTDDSSDTNFFIIDSAPPTEDTTPPAFSFPIAPAREGFINAVEFSNASNDDSILENGGYSDTGGGGVIPSYALGIGSNSDKCDLSDTVDGAPVREYKSYEDFNIGYLKGDDIAEARYRLCRIYTDFSGNKTEELFRGGFAGFLTKDITAPSITLTNTSTTSSGVVYSVVKTDNLGIGSIKVANPQGSGACDSGQTFGTFSGTSVTVTTGKHACFEAVDAAGNIRYRSTDGSSNVPNVDPQIQFFNHDTPSSVNERVTVHITDLDEDDSLTAGIIIKEESELCPSQEEGTNILIKPAGYSSISLDNNGDYQTAALPSGKKVCVWVTDGKVGFVSSVITSGVDTTAPDAINIPTYVNALSANLYINAAEAASNENIIAFPASSYPDDVVKVKYLVTEDGNCSTKNYNNALDDIPGAGSDVAISDTELTVCIRLKDGVGNLAYTKPVNTFLKDTQAPIFLDIELEIDLFSEVEVANGANITNLSPVTFQLAGLVSGETITFDLYKYDSNSYIGSSPLQVEGLVLTANGEFNFGDTVGTPRAEGYYRIEGSLKDPAGNTVFESRALFFTVDRTLPIEVTLPNFNSVIGVETVANGVISGTITGATLSDNLRTTEILSYPSGATKSRDGGSNTGFIINTYSLGVRDEFSECITEGRPFVSLEEFNFAYLDNINNGDYRVCRKYTDNAGNSRIELAGSNKTLFLTLRKNLKVATIEIAPESNSCYKKGTSSCVFGTNDDDRTNNTEPVFIISDTPGGGAETRVSLKDAAGEEIEEKTFTTNTRFSFTDSFGNGVYTAEVTTHMNGEEFVDSDKTLSFIIDLTSPEETRPPQLSDSIVAKGGILDDSFFTNQPDEEEILHSAGVFRDNSTFVQSGNHVKDEYTIGLADTSLTCNTQGRGFVSSAELNVGYLERIADGNYVICRKYTDLAGNSIEVFQGNGRVLSLEKDTNPPAIESIVATRANPNANPDAINNKHAKVGDEVEVVVTFNEAVSSVTVDSFVVGTNTSPTYTLRTEPTQDAPLTSLTYILTLSAGTPTSNENGNIEISFASAQDTKGNEIDSASIATQDTDPSSSDFFYISTPYRAGSSGPYTYRTFSSTVANPTLTEASDSGSSRTDGITNITNPTFNITGITEGIRARIYIFTSSQSEESPAASITRNHNQNGDFTFQSALTPGEYTVSADLIDIAGNKEKDFFTGPLPTVIIHTTAPVEGAAPSIIAKASDGYINASEVDTSSNQAILLPTAPTSTLANVVSEYALGVRSNSDECDLENGARTYVSKAALNLGYISSLADNSFRVCRRYTDTAGNVAEVFAGSNAIFIEKDTVDPPITFVNTSAEDSTIARTYTLGSEKGGVIKIASPYTGTCDNTQSFIAEGTTKVTTVTTTTDDDTDTITGSATIGANKNACFRATDAAGNHAYGATDVNTRPTIEFTGFDSPTNQSQSGTVTVRDAESNSLTVGYRIVNAATCPSSTGVISLSIPSGYTSATLTSGAFELSNLNNNNRVCVWASDTKVGTITSTVVSGVDKAAPNIVRRPTYINTLSDRIINKIESSAATPIIAFPTNSYTDDNPVTLRYLVVDGQPTCSTRDYSSALTAIPTPAQVGSDSNNINVCIRVQDVAGNASYTSPTNSFIRDITPPTEDTEISFVGPAHIDTDRFANGSTAGAAEGFINLEELNTPNNTLLISRGTYSDSLGGAVVDTYALGATTDFTNCDTGVRTFLSINDFNIGYLNGASQGASPIPDGRYRVCRKYVDTAGNETIELSGNAYFLTIDRGEPVVALTTPATSNIVTRTYTVEITSGNIGEPTNANSIEVANPYTDVCNESQTLTPLTGNTISVAGRDHACVRVYDDAGNVSYKATDDGIAKVSIDFSGNGRANTTDALVFYIYALFKGNGFSAINNQNILEKVLENEVNFTAPGSPRLSDSKEDVYDLLERYSDSNAIDFSGNGRANTTDALLFYIYALFKGNGFSAINNQNILEKVLENEVNFTAPGSPRLSDSKEDVYNLLESYSQ